MRNLFILVILPLSLPLEITELHNPFLPINLGEARLTYTNHIFIHYLDYSDIGTQINAINDNIKLVKISYKNLTVEPTNLNSILKHLGTTDLDFPFERLIQKYRNLYPNINSKRTKRGLINPIGTIYKAAFGLLDADDGERINNVIQELSTNQKNLFNSLDRQMSLSKNLIEKLNISLSIISNNQKTITDHIMKLEARYDEFIMSSLKILTLQNIVRQISNDCFMLLELIDQLENAIMFAHLHTIHPSIIKNDEIQEMLNTLSDHYDSDNLIKFKSPLFYYKLLTSQVFFENERIIFTINFPLILKDKFKLYQIIPIPQNNVIYYPTTPFILSTLEQKIMIQEKCPEIESIRYCIQENYQADQCMSSTISTTIPLNCRRRSITLKITLTQRINNNVIIVPQSNDTLRINCDNQEQIQMISRPILVKLNPSCSIEVNKIKFDSNKHKLSTNPLILPKIEMPKEIELPKYQPIEIQDPELGRIQDLKHLVQHPDPLIPVDIKTHSYSGLILFLVLLTIILLAYLWYRYLGCVYLKRPIPTKILSKSLSQIKEMEPIQEEELQTLHIIGTQDTSKGPKI